MEDTSPAPEQESTQASDVSGRDRTFVAGHLVRSVRCVALDCGGDGNGWADDGGRTS